MTVGEKIKARRKELGMTMEDLGRAIGVQRSAVNKYEKGMVELTASKISAISRALNVPLFYLLDDDPEDSDHDILEILHQNPTLRLLFNKQKTLDETDLNAVLAVVNAITKERDPDAE